MRNWGGGGDLFRNVTLTNGLQLRILDYRVLRVFVSKATRVSLLDNHEFLSVFFSSSAPFFFVFAIKLLALRFDDRAAQLAVIIDVLSFPRYHRDWVHDTASPENRCLPSAPSWPFASSCPVDASRNLLGDALPVHPAFAFVRSRELCRWYSAIPAFCLWKNSRSSLFQSFILLSYKYFKLAT